MAFTSHPKTGLPKTIDLQDTTWGQKYLDGNAALEARVGLTTQIDPNGAVEGSWYGQTCWSTSQQVMYECTKPGPATGANKATWEQRLNIPPGSLFMFATVAIPSGFLPLAGGTYTQALYPKLFAVAPTAWKSGSNFTLPDWRGKPFLIRSPSSSNVPSPGNVASTPIAAGEDYPLASTLTIWWGIKF